MRLLYYDIETLKEIFTVCTFDENNNIIYLYYLLPDSYMLTEQMQYAILEEVIKENPECADCDIYLYDLHDERANLHMAASFGVDHPSCKKLSDKCRFIKDVDKEFDENIHHYTLGYNSLNYDMTMLAYYFAQVFYTKSAPELWKPGMKENPVIESFSPTTPERIREFSDELFSPNFKNCMPQRLRYHRIETGKGPVNNYDVRLNNVYLKDDGWHNNNPYFHIYQNMNNTGRHVDIARLNEKQSRVALKRLLGMLGDKIMEPDINLSEKAGKKLLDNFDNVKNIFAYNVSDVIRLPHLFQHKVYRAKFILKKQMLKTYPELVFNDNGQYKPDMKTLRYNRLTINATSAQLASRTLCPYGNLEDAPAVSYDYPAKEKAEELNINVTNVLNDTIEFIETRMRPLAQRSGGMGGAQIISDLYKMIEMYKSIEGNNFNASISEDGTACSTSVFGKNIYVCYMGPDGKPSSCYVNFSIGGIHGAEYNKELYEADLAAYEKKQYLYKRILKEYGTADDLVKTVNEKGKTVKRKTVEFTDGKYPGIYQVSDFLRSGSTLKKAAYKKEFLEPEPPELFPEKDGNRELNKRYTYTSFGIMNHEDFTSYYPRLLMMLLAFWNVNLGYDRYEEVFNNKTDYDFLRKKKNAHMTPEQALIYEGLRKATQLNISELDISDEERALYEVLREGTKLILNSASGAADTEKNNPIRMNNRILTMRIIGQLFAWRIGQAQALEGARVPSTNTDGLYTVMEEKKNNEILYRESEAAHVEIVPELVYLVTKDANNRLEADPETMAITGAGGGTLGCYEGPSPDKALDHPAIYDWALAKFLLYKAQKGAIDEYEPDVVEKIMREDAKDEFKDIKKRLIMFQNITASSPKVSCYHFATREPITQENVDTIEPIFLHHYNRIFYVNPDKVPEDRKKDIVYLNSAYVRPNEKKENIPLAVRVIRDLNDDPQALIRGTVKLKKINGIETDTPCMIVNEQLERSDFDPEWLDYDYYVKTLGSTYKKSWQNKTAGSQAEEEEEEAED